MWILQFLLNEDFPITCDKKEAKTGNLTIKKISIEAHDLRVLQFVARDCYNQNEDFVKGNKAYLKVAMNTISNAKNKFTVVGQDIYAHLDGVQNGEQYSMGCMSICKSLRNVVNGSCSGVRCCEVAIPDGLKDMSMEVRSFHNHTDVSNFNACGYAFVVEQGQFNFSSHYLRNLKNEKLPLVSQDTDASAIRVTEVTHTFLMVAKVCITTPNVWFWMYDFAYDYSTIYIYIYIYIYIIGIHNNILHLIRRH